MEQIDEESGLTSQERKVADSLSDAWNYFLELNPSLLDRRRFSAIIDEGLGMMAIRGMSHKSNYWRP